MMMRRALTAPMARRAATATWSAAAVAHSNVLRSVVSDVANTKHQQPVLERHSPQSRFFDSHEKLEPTDDTDYVVFARGLNLTDLAGWRLVREGIRQMDIFSRFELAVKNFAQDPAGHATFLSSMTTVRAVQKSPVRRRAHHGAVWEVILAVGDCAAEWLGKVPTTDPKLIPHRAGIAAVSDPQDRMTIVLTTLHLSRRTESVCVDAQRAMLDYVTSALTGDVPISAEDLPGGQTSSSQKTTAKRGRGRPAKGGKAAKAQRDGPVDGSPEQLRAFTRRSRLLARALTEAGSLPHINTRMAEACGAGMRPVLSAVKPPIQPLTFDVSPETLRDNATSVSTANAATARVVAFRELVAALAALKSVRPEFAHEMVSTILLSVRDQPLAYRAAVAAVLAECNACTDHFVGGTGLLEGLSANPEMLVRVLSVISSPSKCPALIEALAVEALRNPAIPPELLEAAVCARGSPAAVVSVCGKRLVNQLAPSFKGLRMLAKSLRRLRTHCELPAEKTALTSAVAAFLATATDEMILGFPMRGMGAQTANTIAIAMLPFGVPDDASADTLTSFVHRVVTLPGAVDSIGTLTTLLQHCLTRLRGGSMADAKDSTDTSTASTAAKQAAARALLVVQAGIDGVVSAVPELLDADATNDDVRQVVDLLVALLSEFPEAVSATKRDGAIRGVATYVTASVDLGDIVPPEVALAIAQLAAITVAADEASSINSGGARPLLPLLQHLLPQYLEMQRDAEVTIAASTGKSKKQQAQRQAAITNAATAKSFIQSAARAGVTTAVSALQPSAAKATKAAKPAKTVKQRAKVAVKSPLDQLALMPEAGPGRAPKAEVEEVAQAALEEWQDGQKGTTQSLEGAARLLRALTRVGYRRAAVVKPVAEALLADIDQLSTPSFTDAVGAVALADPWTGIGKWTDAIAQAVAQRRTTITVAEAVDLAEAAAAFAISHRADEAKTSVILRPLVPLLLRSSKDLTPRDALRIVAACARLRLAHPTLYQVLFGLVTDCKGTMPLDDVAALVDVVKATKPIPDLHSSALRVGSTVVGAIVGGVARRGSLDLSGHVLEPLVSALALLSPTDRVCLDVFAACVRRRSEISPTATIKAMELAAAIPTLPAEWKQLAEHAMVQASKPDGGYTADECIAVWALANAGGERDVGLADAVDAHIASKAHEVSASGVAQLFDIAYRQHRNNSEAVQQVLGAYEGYADRMNPEQLHTVVAAMFALRVRNRRAMDRFGARAVEIATSFTSAQLRTIVIVLTKAKAMSAPEVFADAIVAAQGGRTRLDMITAVNCLWFLAVHELETREAYKSYVTAAVSSIASNKDTILKKVHLSIQTWETIQLTRKREQERRAAESVSTVTASGAIGEVEAEPAEEMPEIPGLFPEDLYRTFRSASRAFPNRDSLAGAADSQPAAEPPQASAEPWNVSTETPSPGRGWAV